MTNFEKIKNMSFEEMAKWFAIEIGGECYSCPACDYCIMTIGTSCQERIKQWLESEVEENMLPEICSCGYRFENDETICPNCGKKVEEDG